MMSVLDDELILSILDDDYGKDPAENKIEEEKKNSIPSSPKNDDDSIEIQSIPQTNHVQEEVQIQIHNAIETQSIPQTNDVQDEDQMQIQNDIEIQSIPQTNDVQDEDQIQIQNDIEIQSIPQTNDVQEEVQMQIQNAIPTQNIIQTDIQKQEEPDEIIDSLDELFKNPRENPPQKSNKANSVIELENPQPETEQENSSIELKEEEPQQKQPDNRAKLLAERLRQKAKLNKPKRQLSFSFDFSSESSDSVGLKIVVPQKKRRQLLREQMLEAHSKVIKDDINEEPNQEIQEEEYEIEEEEEEEKNEELKDNEIAKTVLEELKKEDEDEDKENLTEEQLEHRLYERIVEMRLSEDLEEIKKIIRIITGQWRSGKLRFGDIAEGLEKAFEGNEQEMKDRKDLETKRMMRKQRRQKKNEEKTRKLTQESISQLIERAMWIKAGQDENASASDIIRGEMARLSDNDPRKAIMERLEMDAFIQEERAKNALKERRISKNQMQKVERTSSGSRENSFSKITFKSSQISHQHTFSFNLSKEKSASKESNPSPKKPERKNKKVDKSKVDKLADFLNKINK